MLHQMSSEGGIFLHFHTQQPDGRGGLGRAVGSAQLPAGTCPGSSSSPRGLWWDEQAALGGAGFYGKDRQQGYFQRPSKCSADIARLLPWGAVGYRPWPAGRPGGQRGPRGAATPLTCLWGSARENATFLLLPFQTHVAIPPAF